MTQNVKPLIVITGASSGRSCHGKAAFGAWTCPAAAGSPYRSYDGTEPAQYPVPRVDVTDRHAFTAAVQDAEQQFGPVDALINNAGVMLLGAIEQQDAGEWDKMFDVNVKGLLNGVQAVTAGMIDRKSGTIINISSVAGRKTFPNHTVYVGTKFAVHGMSENLREELSPHNVRVIVIAPGAVETELLSHTTSEAIKDGYHAWKAEMGGKVLSADDVASSIDYAYSQPQSVCVREIVLAATRQGA